jgi:hypothetical protein
MSDMETLNKIINETIKKPTIVNVQSKFVVVTYWWGGTNLNNNTARPCVAYYQDLISSVIQYTINYFFTLLVKKNKFDIGSPEILMENFSTHIQSIDSFKELISRFAKDYFYLMQIHFSLLQYGKNETKIKEELTRKLKEGIQDGTVPADFVLKTQEEVQNYLTVVMIKMIEINKDTIFNLFLTNKDANTIKKMFFEEKETLSGEEKRDTLEQVRLLAARKKEFNDTINKTNGTKQTFTILGKTLNNSSVIDVLNDGMRYIAPLSFQKMIDNWEKSLAKSSCNYLSVEYTFTNYQMAINAKPYFIRKALDLCGPTRNVLYIDGDMFIRKYPSLFDIQNVDFMARGWWIDPRASYNIVSSILYDPYVFETSGGTMFYSQSQESKQLLQAWMDESKEERQRGKADDRILSLIFNTKKFLLGVNIIQLPIEYLWLTIDYDERMLEHVYDYDQTTMNESIFIEHPQCLTSEESASGAGASNDRTPKYYNFLTSDNAFLPVSEECYEYIMFPNREMTASFKSYNDFMRGTHYLDDGNKMLQELGFVHPGNPVEDNEQPLYIFDYDKKFAKKQNTVTENMRIVKEELDDNFFRKNQDKIKLTPNPLGFIELEGSVFDALGEEYLVPMIIRLLSKGYNILYKPKGFSPEGYTQLLLRKDTNLEFVFFPMMNKMKDVYKPIINLNEPMLFRASKKDSSSYQGLNTQFGSFNVPSPSLPEANKEDSILIMTLSMFPTLEEFSGYLTYGSYQTMSRIRIGYAFKPKDRSRPSTPVSFKGGKYYRRRPKNYFGGDAVAISENVSQNLTQEDEDKFIEDYESGLKIIYGMHGGRGKRRYTTRKNRFRKRKITKRRKKNKRSLKKKRKRATMRGS